MVLREFLQARRKTEFPTFVRVIEAMPLDQLDYRPHERSPSGAELVWILACETRACSELIDSGRVDWDPGPPPPSEELLPAFEEAYRDLDDRISRLDEEAWSQRVGRLFSGGRLCREATLGEFLWYLFFDAIHHRGQLSTYIRPMGGRVPSIYGPSGDDPGR